MEENKTTINQNLEELVKIAKANNKKFESMKKNLQVLAWISILGVVAAVFAAVVMA
ncbi:hypothetical protein [uncultured Polaribacter sp.]|uniref:hypothetical protein n=1 Tax=uncultured Polaribacter sp. TaxID=174711 RepID=UPI002621E4EB|nr:hypothetical protein [uncultured Polaribacter sp.]